MQMTRYAITAQKLQMAVAYNAVTCTLPATIAQHIAFLHSALCSPALSTLCDALDTGFLFSFPEINISIIIIIIISNVIIYY